MKKHTRLKRIEQLEARRLLTGSPVDLDLDSSGAADATEFVQLGDSALFSAQDAANGRELWITDGTPAGTNLLVDINPNANASAPSDFVVFNGSVFFAADDGTNGRELWSTDGTSNGTAQLSDLLSGSDSSSPRDLVVVGDRLFFTADTVDGQKLWVSDGTAAGTSVVAEIVTNGSSNPSQLTNVDGTLFFTADDGFSGRELWQSDGTSVGTVQVKDIFDGVPSSSPQSLTVVGDQLYFVAETADEGRELWVSDGTDAGTNLVQDINSGTLDGLDDANEMIALNNTLLFVATDGTDGTELWSSDGTEAGTQLLVDIQAGSGNGISSAEFVLVGSEVFFAANDGSSGTELWKTDGTASGTQLVSDIRAGSESSSPDNYAVVNGSLFFTADDGSNGNELWESDGTGDGTTLVADLNRGSQGALPSELSGLNEFVLFKADAGTGSEAWSVDTTADPIPAPSPVNDSYTVIEDNTLTVDEANGVRSNDPTITDGTLTATIADPPANGSVSLLENGQFTYTPEVNFSGTDTFTYTLSTTTSTSEAATVTITVEAVSDPPTAVDDIFDATNGGQQQTLDVLANDSDPDGATTLTITDVSNGSDGGTTSIVDGQIAYTPATNFVGDETFSYTIEDGDGQPSIATATVTVTDSTPGNAVTGVVYVDHDSDGTQGDGEAGIPGVQVTLTGDGDDGVTLTTLSDNNGRYRFRGVPEGTYTMTRRQPKAFEDPDNPSNTSDVLVAGEASFEVTGTDAEVEADAAAEGSLRSEFHSIVWYFAKRTSPQSSDEIFREMMAIAEENSGEDELAAQIRAGNTDTSRPDDSQNEAPTAVDDSFTVVQDETLTVSVADGVLNNDTDPEDDTLTATLVDDVSNGTLNLSGDGSFSYEPNDDFFGTDSFTYTASDDTNTSATATVTITVEEDMTTNTAPTSVDDSFNVDEDVTLTVAVAEGVLANDTDTENDTLTVRVVTSTTSGQLTLADDGSFSYVPDADFAGEDTFTYVANDGTEDSNEATVTITVDAVNDAPSAFSDSFTTSEDTTLTVAANAPGVLGNDTDVDDTDLTARIIEPPEGTFSLLADGGFTFTPLADFNGEVDFTYEVSDGNGGTAQATATITVTAENDAPVAVDDSYQVDEDTVLAVDAALALLVNDSDVDNDTLTAVALSQPSNGALSLSDDGTFTYTPNQNFAGTDSFTYAANDGTTASESATVTIEVAEIDDPGTILLPSEFTNDPQNVAERTVGEAITIPVTVDDPDEDDEYVYQLDLDNSGIPEGAARPSIDSTTGEISWTPSSVGGPFTIRVIVVNSDRTADQETFLINILPEDVLAG